MKNSDIVQLHKVKWQELKAYLYTYDEDWWAVGPSNKWTSGQHVVHLQQSITAVLGALKMPSIVLKYKFGSANRPVRDYDTIVKKYIDKMKEAGPVVSPLSQSMPDTPAGSRDGICTKFEQDLEKLQRKLSKYSDKKLDSLLIPHPLMGRMIMREFFMWHAFHIGHHHDVLKAKY